LLLNPPIDSDGCLLEMSSAAMCPSPPQREYVSSMMDS
jgi:hypothetical protein